MADQPEQTGDAKTQDENNNAIFDNGIDLVEQSLIDKFTPKEPEEEPEEETDEVEEDLEQDEQEAAAEAEEEEETEESEDSKDEDSEEDEEADEVDLSDKQQAAFDKRINRKLKQLERQYDEKFKELEQAKVEAEAPTDALSQVNATMDIKRIDKIEDEAEKTIDFVDDNPDGFTVNEGKDDERFMDRQELLAMRRNARSALKAAKKRRTLIKEKSTIDTEVYKSFPQLKDKGSDEYVAVEAVLNEIPALREHPKGTAFAIYMLMGEEVASKPQKKAVKKKASPKAPKLPETKPPQKKPASQAAKSVDYANVEANAGDQSSLEAALLQKFS